MAGKIALIGFAGFAMTASSVFAAPLVLSDRGSDVVIDPVNGGQVGWFIDGQSQLFNQNFFYRAGGMTDERDITTLTLTGQQTTDTNFFDDPRDDTLNIQYDDTANGLQFAIRYTLQGTSPGSGSSDLAESIRIRNTGALAQTVSFFQYVDFDLNGTAGGDFGQIVNGRVAQQVDITGNISATETVVSPAPDFYDMLPWPNVLAAFFDGLPTTLSNAGALIGPGDLAWGFQWNFTLAPGQEVQISKDKLVTIPAPSAVALFGLAGLGLGARRRR